MARLARYYIKGQPQNIIQRGRNKNEIFLKDADYQYYLDCLYEAAKRHEMLIHAYVLMPDHVHILATPKHEKSISKTMQLVGQRYVQYFNHHYQRNGTLWESRYRATVIEGKQYLLTCMRYIELNPVRLKMVKQPGDYRWSSYQGNSGLKKNKHLSPHKQYKKLGDDKKDRQEAYRALFTEAINNTDLEAIRSATHKGWVLGDEKFCAKVEKLSGRRALPKPRGRPKKEKNAA